MSELLQKYDIDNEKLTVSHGFHSQNMDGATNDFYQAIKAINFQEPAIPLFSCANGLRYPKDVMEVKNLFAQQISVPVKFFQAIENLLQNGVNTLIEIGPSDALSNILK